MEEALKQATKQAHDQRMALEGTSDAPTTTSTASLAQAAVETQQSTESRALQALKE